MPKKYEDVDSLVDEILEKNRSRWKLEVIRYYSFDDFKQDIKLHVWKKFHKWDQTKAFAPWCSKLITNQLINKKRNLFSNHSKPCSDCHWNKGMDACGWTASGLQCGECKDFSHWEKTKKSAYEMKIAGSIEADDGEILIGDHGDINYEGFLKSLGERLRKEVDDDMSQISLVTLKIFNYSWVENLSDDEISAKMGYKSNEKDRSPGYRNLSLHRKYIKNIAKEMLEKEDHDFA